MLYVDMENMLASNWDERMHETHKPMPANAQIWGLTLFDWDGSFKKRLKKISTTDMSIPFQYLESIPNWDKSADWKDVGEIMGRFETPAIYAQSNAQEISLSLLYSADALRTTENTRSHWTLENIELYTKRLQSLVYPQYDGRYGAPMKVILNIGNTFRNIPLVIKQVTVEHQAPYDTLTGLSRMRKITVSARISYPMYQGIGQMNVWTAYEYGATDLSKYGPDVFAIEVLDQKWKPGGAGSNPYSSAFSRYS